VSDSAGSRAPRGRARRRKLPVARHGHLKSPHPLAQIVAVLAAIVAVALVSTGAVTAFAVWDAARTIEDTSVDIGAPDEQLPPTIGEIEGGVNMLLVGTDSCEGQDVTLFPRCKNKDAPGERNDVTMLVHISDNPRRVTVVSFPRDMIVPIPSCPQEEGGASSAMSGTPLNASYFTGGLNCTVLTIEQLTGEDVQFAAAVRWTGVINISDAVGGVDVCIENGISDGHTGLFLDAGEYTLQGVQALQFLRTRHGVGDGSDLGRISNQQQFMSSLVRKAQSDEVLTNPATLFNIATTTMQQVTAEQLVLSTSLANPTRMVQIAMALKNVPFEDIVFLQYPTGYTNDAQTVVPIRASADKLFQALRENKPLELTGEASQGDGVVVVGEAQPVTPPTGETPDAAAPTPGATPDAAATPPATPVAEERVQLPSDISGQTAAQVTCSAGNG
jgi:LCP family protein required for cell wall assembly